MKKIWKWIRTNITTIPMLICLIIAELIFWSPSIVLGIMALINPVWWAAFGAYTAFWACPLTPAIPCQLAIAFALNKLYLKLRGKDEDERK